MVHSVAEADGAQLLRLNNLALALHDVDEIANNVVELLCFAQELLALLLHRHGALQHLRRHHMEAIAIGMDALLGEGGHCAAHRVAVDGQRR